MLERDLQRQPFLTESQKTPEEYASIRRMLERRDGFVASGKEEAYNAELPSIIGYVPSEERRFFQSFVLFDLYKRVDFANPTSDSYQKVAGGMPTVLRLIQEDVESIGGISLTAGLLRRTTTETGQTPGSNAASQWHLDPLGYLISDSFPTEFCAGEASVDYSEQVFGRPKFHIEETSVVAAPPFAIVRALPLTAHRSPTFYRLATRTFFAVTTTDGRK